jgi:murein DD-endopeptidase MepM/ murein hydrolase activator NlpD
MQLIWIAGPSGRMRSWTLRRAHVLGALSLAILLPMAGTLGNVLWRWYGGQEQVQLQAQQQEQLHDINSRLTQMVAQVQLLEQQKSDMLRLLGARVSTEEAPAGKGSLGFQGGPFKLLMGVGLQDDPWAATEHEINTHTTWVRRLNRQWQKEQAQLQAMPLSFPLASGYDISSEFGARQDPFTGMGALHEGLDFTADPGTPVLATASGWVVRAGYAGAYGQMVELDHGKGYVTRYAHMRKLLVREGAQVQRGDPVGELGNTGRSTGAHLHYEIRYRGQAINPQTPLMAWNR